jgi:hypothetical protein
LHIHFVCARLFAMEITPYLFGGLNSAILPE